MLAPHILGLALVAACIMPVIVRQSSRTCASGIAEKKLATEASLTLVLSSAIRFSPGQNHSRPMWRVMGKAPQADKCQYGSVGIVHSPWPCGKTPQQASR